MKEITLTLSIEDTNLILEGLGNMQFNKVYGLISKVQEQAGEQLREHELNEAEGVDKKNEKPGRMSKK